MGRLVLSDIERDALNEIGNIGAGNASTALAKMTNRAIELTVPKTAVVPFEELPLVASQKPEKVLASAYVAFEGDAGGCLLLLFSAEQAESLFALLGLEVPDDVMALSEIQRSAVSEAGNIIASSYLHALGKFTGLRLLPVPPGVAVGMGGAILQTIAAHLGRFDDMGLVVQVHIHSRGEKLGLQLLMMPRLDAFGAILGALGIDVPKEKTG
ncbi:MAG: chemotaxis protein CheC [Armatimonadota bacterium]